MHQQRPARAMWDHTVIIFLFCPKSNYTKAKHPASCAGMRLGEPRGLSDLKLFDSAPWQTSPPLQRHELLPWFRLSLSLKGPEEQQWGWHRDGAGWWWQREKGQEGAGGCETQRAEPQGRVRTLPKSCWMSEWWPVTGRGSSWGSGSPAGSVWERAALQCFGVLKSHWLPSRRPKADWGDSQCLIPTENESKQETSSLWRANSCSGSCRSTRGRASAPLPPAALSCKSWEPWAEDPQGTGHTEGPGRQESLFLWIFPTAHTVTRVPDTPNTWWMEAQQRMPEKQLCWQGFKDNIFF